MPVNPARGKPRQVRWHVAYQSEDMVTDDEIRLSGWGGDERRGATATVGGDGDLRWDEQRCSEGEEGGAERPALRHVSL
jgi:hypothetical protein